MLIMKLFPDPIHEHRDPGFYIYIFFCFIVCYIICQCCSMKPILKHMQFAFYMISITGICICKCIVGTYDLVL